MKLFYQFTFFCFIIENILVSGQSVDYDFVEECPEKFGFYADAVQCDRYYECKEGEVRQQYNNSSTI